MSPDFDLGEYGFPLALARGLFVSALFLSYGTMLFRSALAGPSSKDMTQLYRRLGLCGIVAALGLLCLWLVVQSAAMADAQDLPATLQTVPAVLTATAFGHTVMLQAAALLAALAILALRRAIGETFAFATFFTGLAVMLQAWHGHAAAMYDGFSPLLLCEILHLLAASSWLGSLVPLLLLVRRGPADTAIIAARRYAAFGTWCVVILLASAAWQGCVLISSLAALTGTAYGWLALTKASLLLVLLGFAAVNRFWLTPAQDVKGLARSIAIETFFGVMVVQVASTLVMLPPGMHM